MEAVARMRCSSGLVVERYLGSFHRRTVTDIDLPAINADQSIAVQLRYDDKLDKEAFFQFVVLYTSTLGERRIRYSTAKYDTLVKHPVHPWLQIHCCAVITQLAALVESRGISCMPCSCDLVM